MDCLTLIIIDAEPNLTETNLSFTVVIFSISISCKICNQRHIEYTDTNTLLFPTLQMYRTEHVKTRPCVRFSSVVSADSGYGSARLQDAESGALC